MQLNREELIRAWRDMMTIRRFEERVQEEFSKGGIPGFVHLYAGEEASAVGMCMHLGPKDYIASTHRGHGHSIAKGCDVVGMMCELFARQDGLCGGKGGSMHIADLDQGMLGANGIVGGGPPLVVGAALTAKTLNTGTVAVCFSGDGASNQGTTFEAMNMAVVLKLPAVFVFENNQYGEGTGVGYAVGSHDIAGRAAGFGLPAVKVSGDDFFAVHEAAREARSLGMLRRQAAGGRAARRRRARVRAGLLPADVSRGGARAGVRLGLARRVGASPRIRPRARRGDRRGARAFAVRSLPRAVLAGRRARDARDGGARGRALRRAARPE